MKRPFVVTLMIAMLVIAPAILMPTHGADKTQAFHGNCVAQQNATLTGDLKEKFCACAAGHYVRTMTDAQTRAMLDDTPEGQIQRTRMITEVYAPCLQYPTQALLHKNCMENAGLAAQGTNHAAICGCMATDMAAYVAEKGPAVIRESLRRNPEDTDPLARLTGSQEFETEAQKRLIACVVKHASGAGQ